MGRVFRVLLDLLIVYFIDRALVTFSVEDQKTYREGLPELQKRVTELFPGVALFSAATPDQQGAVLESLDEAGAKADSQRPQRLRYRRSAAAQPLFEVLRVHTIGGFLIDPEVGRKGNRDGLGWSAANCSTAFNLRLVFTTKIIPAGSQHPPLFP